MLPMLYYLKKAKTDNTDTENWSEAKFFSEF